MQARGERTKRGAPAGNQNWSGDKPATVAGLSEKTTEELAREAAMAPRTIVTNMPAETHGSHVLLSETVRKGVRRE
jgi:hypothetical protein